LLTTALRDPSPDTADEDSVAGNRGGALQGISPVDLILNAEIKFNGLDKASKSFNDSPDPDLFTGNS
jgi:hypothetical protein